MRLFSLSSALVGARLSAQRFPLILLSSLVAGASAMVLAENTGLEKILIRLVMVGILGIPLLFGLKLWSEVRGKAKPPGWLVQLGGLASLVAYYFILPEKPDGAPLIRFFLFLLGCHFLVSFFPFLGRSAGNALWQYNKILLLRFVSSAAYSMVMYLGLSLALAALDNLFGLDFGGETFSQLFLFIVFFFHTWFFLGGAPQNLDVLEFEQDYPRPLRVFAQHILATLVMVYQGILLAYLVKVVATGHWPSGWIGYLVSGVSVVGIFSILLLYPLLVKQTNRWLRFYARMFYILLIPAIVMLLLAIAKRVSQYGITEMRYLLLVLAAWLLFPVVMGLWRRRPPILAIPLSLFMVALIISFGPWGAFSISRHSQLGRLEDLLLHNGLLKDGLLVAAPIDSLLGDQEQIQDLFHYLIEHHEAESVAGWFDEILAETFAARSDSQPGFLDNTSSQTRAIMDHLNLEMSGSVRPDQGWVFSLGGVTPDRVYDLAGFEVAWPLSLSGDKQLHFAWNDITVVAGIDEDGTTLFLTCGNRGKVEFSLNELVENLQSSYPAPEACLDVDQDEMVLDTTTGQVRARVLIFSISGTNNPGLVVNDLRGLILLSRGK